MSIFKTILSPENSYCMKNSMQKSFYIYFDSTAKKFKPSGERIPLNISLAVDRSGSMSGAKLENVKKAVDFVIDNLSSDDYISIVQYDDRIETVSQSAKITNKKDLHKKVQTITARGMTNLSGGMLESYNQVEGTKKEKYVNRVLLLSDGLANAGVTEAEKLQQIVQKKFREKGVGLSTFGVGSDFNELLMTNLSEYGGANYHFIESPEEIPTIFAKELDGLLSVVSQNTKLTLKFPEANLVCSKVYGYPYETERGSVKINFNDVISEENKAILIKFDIKTPITEDFEFNVNFEYQDVVESLDSISEEFNIKVELTEDAEKFQTGVNEKVIEQITFFSANELYENAISKADKKDKEGAETLLNQAKSIIENFLKSHKETQELKTLYKQILDYQSQLENMHEMTQVQFAMSQKSNRSMQYLSKRKKGL